MWQRVKQWWAQPFSTDMSGREWFAFIGLLIVIVALWNVILFHVVSLVRDSKA